jgi:hypothetical protein
VHVPLFICSWLRGADQTPAIEVALYFGLSAKPADCRVDTVVLRQDAKVAKSAKKGRAKQRLLPWRFLASLGVAWRDATTTRGGRSPATSHFGGEPKMVTSGGAFALLLRVLSVSPP